MFPTDRVYHNSIQYCFLKVLRVKFPSIVKLVAAPLCLAVPVSLLRYFVMSVIGAEATFKFNGL